MRIDRAVARSVSRILVTTSEPPSCSNPPNAYLGHLVSELPLRADAPHQSCDSKHDTHDNSGVCLPVLRLSVPTTGGRPDVLGVPVVAMLSAIESHHARVRGCYTYGTLAPPPMSACVGLIVGVFEVLGGYLPINRLYSGGEVGAASAGVGGDGFVCASELAVVCLMEAGESPSRI